MIEITAKVLFTGILLLDILFIKKKEIIAQFQIKV